MTSAKTTEEKQSQCVQRSLKTKGLPNTLSMTDDTKELQFSIRYDNGIMTVDETIFTLHRTYMYMYVYVQ